MSIVLSRITITRFLDDAGDELVSVESSESDTD